MHSYLQSIGFKNITKEQLNDLIYQIERQPDTYESSMDSENNEFAEMRLQVAENIGIAIRGIYDEDDQFHMDYYYPYCISENISSSEDIDVIKQSDKECYQGLCDEVKIGVNLIFYLQNVVSYLKIPKSKRNEPNYNGVCLSGLSLSGKVLLPIYKTEMQVKNALKNGNDRNLLIAAAREGDEEAIENLTMNDMDTYSKISKRIQKEDILSIVNSYFMPYGIESDKYTILGEILDVKEIVNQVSLESVYIMKINCNELNFSLAINKKDILGEPLPGRRFKGDIWMQGNIDYI